MEERPSGTGHRLFRPGLSQASSRAAGGWRLTGQKTWTTRGAFCTHLFGLFRTDPEAERHRGLTFILVPLDTEGITVRPIAQLDGETGFAEVFLDEGLERTVAWYLERRGDPASPGGGR